jgi:2-hydroxycyclohexanecarboxyl-CoA dehydrogenase
MDLGLDAKVVIVTGGASNLGRATSRLFAHEGAIVAIFDRDEKMARRTAADIAAAGGKAVVFDVDLTDLEATAVASAAVEAELGPVEVLVNNVGWGDTADFFLGIPPARWQKNFELNLLSTFIATHAVLPKMVDRRGGVVISISSDAGFGEYRMADYGAFKAGVMAFTRTIAKEYGRYGIRANTVCPGIVVPAPADIGERSLWQVEQMTPAVIQEVERSLPLRRRPEAVDIAAAVVFLASAPARMLTGQVLSVSGGFQMPR